METEQTGQQKTTRILLSLSGVFVLFFAGLTLFNYFSPVEVSRATSGDEQLAVADTAVENEAVETTPTTPTLDKTDYARRMLRMANNSLFSLLSDSTIVTYASSTGTTTTTIAALDPQALFAEHTESWPAEASYPAVGAILPFQRIIAYYGNFYSTRMGALGEYPPEEMKRRLLADVAKWEAADPETPVIPAIDYVAMVAQADAGNDGMYRKMMPNEHIDKAHRLAKEVNGILILEVQSGLADLQTEIERFEPWLKEPDVHLAIDPEFAMHNGSKPGSVVGMVDAQDINTAAQYLKELAIEHNLPPKVMLVHRFTQDMVQGYADIKPNEYTQIVMVMDGWGPPANKIGTYYHITEPEPVQFTGFKVFYGNDMKPPSTRLLTPAEILDLTPRPLFIQYQ